jgi:hypothetical protein
MLPATIYVVYGAKEFRTREWTDMDVSEEAGGLDVAMLLSWIIWLYSGFGSLGALAGEIKDPSKSYPVVIAVLVPLVRTLVVVAPSRRGAMRTCTLFCKTVQIDENVNCRVCRSLPFSYCR